MQCTGSVIGRRPGVDLPGKTMQYEYSVHFNEVQQAWQVNWVCFDSERPHNMKGDVVVCDSMEEAIETIRRLVAQFEPDRLNDIV